MASCGRLLQSGRVLLSCTHCSSTWFPDVLHDQAGVPAWQWNLARSAACGSCIWRGVSRVFRWWRGRESGSCSGSFFTARLLLMKALAVDAKHTCFSTRPCAVNIIGCRDVRVQAVASTSSVIGLLVWFAESAWSSSQIFWFAAAAQQLQASPVGLYS